MPINNKHESETLAAANDANFYNNASKEVLQKKLDHMKWDIFPEYLEHFCGMVDNIMKCVPEKVAKDERVTKVILDEAGKLVRHTNLGLVKADINIHFAANDDSNLLATG